VRLVPIDQDWEIALSLGYQLMQERESEINISHKEVPEWDDHCEYMKNHPYKDWFILFVGGDPVGTLYVTQKNEVGIFILKEFKSKGYGTEALKILKWGKDTKFYANINPDNFGSKMFFTEKMGAKLVQLTYKF